MSAAVRSRPASFSSMMTWLRVSSAVVVSPRLLEVSQEATQRDSQLGSWEQGRLEVDHERPAECLGLPVADLDGDRDRPIELLEAGHRVGVKIRQSGRVVRERETGRPLRRPGAVEGLLDEVTRVAGRWLPG